MTATEQLLDILPSHARVWIYQSDRALTTEEADWVLQMSNQFIQQWNTHGKKLVAGAELVYNQFLVLAVDETVQSASGCSIDSSVQLIRTINQQLGIDLLNRKAACLIDSEVHLFDLQDIKTQIASGTIQKDTPVFNNLVPDLGSLRSNWMVKAEDSWMSKYFR